LARGTLREAASAMSGQLLHGDPDAHWSGAALDSRQITGGELFFALSSGRTDGHRFVGESLARGAAGAVVEEAVSPPATGGLIKVDDSLGALHLLTRHVRARLPERLVAVTGSAGKTTTKDLLALMLAKRYAVARNPGNLNNLFGFPISLLGVPEGTEWMVAEMGMSTPGELRQLAELGRPDFIIYTNVRPVHLEFFESLRGIAEAKAELLEGLSSEGIVIANADDREVVRIVARHPCRKVWFGLEQNAEFGAESVVELPSGGSRFVFRVGDDRYPASLPLYGRYSVENFLAAAACAHTVGLDIEEILEAAAQAEPGSGRGVVHRLPENVLLVDDTYNSNPDALSQAMVSARALEGRRHWAVLGSMLELGAGAADFHRQLGREAVGLGFAPVLAVGTEARALAEGVSEAGGTAVWMESAEEAAVRAGKELAPGDVVLIKGSRGIGLDLVVEHLLGDQSQQNQQHQQSQQVEEEDE